MKKIILVAILISMLAINAVAAQTVTEIRITGSTAFRSALVNQLRGGYVWGSAGGSGANASQQIFVSSTIIIKTSWSGSAGGIYSLATNSPAAQPFIVDPVSTKNPDGTTSYTVGTGSNKVTLTNTGANIPAADITESHTADVALSDVYPESTSYTGPGFVTLTDTIVGVVPFEWVKGAYTPDGTLGSAVAGGYPGVTNITSEEAQELLGGGLALSQFTGNPADNAIFVGAVGGDHNSGARLAAILESQYGGAIYGSPSDSFELSVLQYIPNGATVGSTQFSPQSAGSGIIHVLNPWPVETVSHENRPAGSEGFFSDSYIAATLNRPCDTSPGNYIISYLGMSDANDVNGGVGYSYTDSAGVTTTITPSQNALTLDGTYPGTAAHPFAPPYTNIIEGRYTFWRYEHLLYATTFGGTPKAIADSLASGLTAEADFGGVGVLLSAMHCSRAGDGSLVVSP